MTTKIETPIAPSVTADVVHMAGLFNVSAATRNHPLSELFSRWIDLRIASARHDPDVLANVSFADVVDRVITLRCGGSSFDVLEGIR